MKIISTPSYEDENKDVTTQSWIIWSCAAVFYLYEMILRASPSVMSTELMQDFQVASTSLGVLSSFYYYSYFILQIPCGMIVDWLGTRRVIAFSALLCVVGSFIFALSTSLLMAKMGRFLIGAGSACAFISCLKIGSQWFMPAQFVFIAGLTNMMGTVGGIFSGPPFAVLVNSYGWRSAMMIAAFLGIGIAFLAWILIRDRAPHETITKRSILSLAQGIKQIASVPQNWLIAVYGGLMYVPISAFCELWAVPYIMRTYEINNETASSVSIMVYLGTAVGGVFAAWLSNRWNSRLKVMSVSALSSMVIFGYIALADYIPFEQLYIVLFFAGFVSGGQVLCFTAIKEGVPNHLSATAVGFTNAIVMMSGIIFQPLLGHVLDCCWDGAVLADGLTPLYSKQDYQQAILAVPLAMLISWFFIIFSGSARIEEKFGKK